MSSRTEQPFRVAIVGGAIGGLFTALSLHHHCSSENIQIDVYEQAPQYKEIGAGVGIGVNAAVLLHRIGIGEEVNAIAGDRSSIWISFRRYDNGNDIVTVPADNREKIRNLPVHRADFLDLLIRTIQERNAATLHTNKACQGVTDERNIVSISFKDGTTATANLVIGCDGIHSVVRSQFSADHPRYSGKIAYRGLLDIKELESWWSLPCYSVSWLAKNRHFLVFPISRNRILNVVAFVTTPEEDLGGLRESWTTRGKKADLMKDYEDFEPTVQRIIQGMSETPSKWKLNDREPLEQWVHAGGKVVLMGDAAHAMLPHQGAGAGQAIEDGYVLGRAMQDFLRSSGGRPLEDWMQLYQTTRLPRAQKVQQTSRQAGDIYQMKAEDLKNEPFEECLPQVAERIRTRMQWIWTEDIDVAYEKAKSERNLS